RHPPCPPLFPYTTLFRSIRAAQLPERAGIPAIGTTAGGGRLSPAGVVEPAQHPKSLKARDRLAASLIEPAPDTAVDVRIRAKARSEEHTSELQSRFDLVC